jgi:hypothetical protein
MLQPANCLIRPGSLLLLLQLAVNTHWPEEAAAQAGRSIEKNQLCHEVIFLEMQTLTAIHHATF